MKIESDSTREIIRQALTHDELSEIHSNVENGKLKCPGLTDLVEQKIFLNRFIHFLEVIPAFAHEYGHLADVLLRELHSFLLSPQEIAKLTLKFSKKEEKALISHFQAGEFLPPELIFTIGEKVITLLSKKFPAILYHTVDIVHPLELVLKANQSMSFQKIDDGPLMANIYDRELRNMEVVAMYFEIAAYQIIENTFKKLGWIKDDLTLKNKDNLPSYMRAKRLAFRLHKRNLKPGNSTLRDQFDVRETDKG